MSGNCDSRCWKHPSKTLITQGCNSSICPCESKRSSNLLEVLSRRIEFEIFVSILTLYPEISNLLTSSVELTVFAPINSAFDGIDPSTLDPETLKVILETHLVQGVITSTKLLTDKPLGVETLSSFPIFFKYDNLNISIYNNPQFTGTASNIIPPVDLRASNGIIHAIDNIIIPVVQTPTNNTISTAINNIIVNNNNTRQKIMNNINSSDNNNINSLNNNNINSLNNNNINSTDNNNINSTDNNNINSSDNKNELTDKIKSTLNKLDLDTYDNEEY